MAMSSTDLRSEAQNQGAMGTRKGEIMNKESVTKRLRPGIRLGLSGAIIAGLSVLGAGALEAGTAGANTIGGGGVIKLPPTCPSTVSLSTTYGYTYLIASGDVVGLSGSGCSTSSHPVTITLPNLLSSSDVISPQETVTPNCPATAPTDCTFSFSFSLESPLYLTEAEAVAAYPDVTPAQFKVQFVANQAATGAGYTLTFWLWTPSGV
jgi:hypothetical protein